MILLWTRNNLPGSKIIRWGLEEESSHFCIAHKHSKTGKHILVHQRLMGGFELDWLPAWLKTNEVVYSLEPKEITHYESSLIFEALANEFSETDYDHGAFLYFSYRAALRKFTGKQLPRRNQWGSNKDPLCTGYARVLQKMRPEWFSSSLPDFDIVTPDALYHNMANTQFFKGAIHHFYRR
jgi:hypothetical protein